MELSMGYPPNKDTGKKERNSLGYIQKGGCRKHGKE
jgi:hypothetical protein